MAVRPLRPRRSTWLPAASSRAPNLCEKCGLSVNGYGIAPAAERAVTAPSSTEANGQKCYYVLDVLLCD